MRIKHSTLAGIAALALTGSLGVTTASAAVIGFNQASGAATGGSLSYGGTGGPLFGSAIRLADVALSGAAPPAGNDSSLFCQGCALNFATGLNRSEGAPAWTFDAVGSSFMVTGDVYERNNLGRPIGPPIVQGTLASGFFTGTSTAALSSVDLADDLVGVLLTFNGSGTDQKSNDLRNYFGLAETTEFSFATTLASLADNDFTANGGFTANITGASVSNGNTPVANDVPEPAGLGVFGLALALIGAGFGCRRVRKPAKRV